MINFHVRTVLLSAITQLEHAAGIWCDDRLRVGLGDGLHLLFEKMAGHFGMGEVVDARAAAATVRAFRFYEFDSWNGLQQLTWLTAYPLAVGEMARILVGNAHFQRREFANEPGV